MENETKIKRTRYDPEIIKTKEGQDLYNKWRTVKRNVPENGTFADFENFYNWAVRNGHQMGTTLIRYSKEKPFEPGNCVFVQTGEKDDTYYPSDYIRIYQWNRTVNRLRKAVGLPLFPEEPEGDIDARFDCCDE